MYFIKRACRRPERLKNTDYVWLVVALGFLTNFLTVGSMLAMLGNLTVTHQEMFNIGIQESSLISSVHSAMFYFFGKYSTMYCIYNRMVLIDLFSTL